MQEYEAREKWCPFAETAKGARVNGPREDWEDNRCIGSDCMAWRQALHPDGTASGDYYCGLAGEI